MALIVIVAQNYHVETLVFIAKRSVYGIPVVCLPAIAPDGDITKCIAHQASVDIAYGLISN